MGLGFLSLALLAYMCGVVLYILGGTWWLTELLRLQWSAVVAMCELRPWVRGQKKKVLCSHKIYCCFAIRQLYIHIYIICEGEIC